MFEFILKQLKSKKGFTLVELVVVIAILGILAAIAVPRLTGFTKTAEEQADKVTATTVKNAVALALANKDIEVTGTGKITFTKETRKFTKDNNITKPTDADIDGFMKNLVGSIQLKSKSKIVVTIDTDDVDAVLE